MWAGPNLRGGLAGAGAVLAAFAVMAGMAAFGLARLEAGAGSLMPMTAAVVVLAVGGSVDVDAGVSGAGLRGSVEVMPLGVSVTGSVVLAVAYLLPLRRRDHAALASQAVGALVMFVPVVIALVLMGHGRLPTGARGAEFHADLVTGLGGGLLWMVAVLALGWLISRRAPLPDGWAWAHRIRPVLSATATVVLALLGVGIAAGLVFGAVVAGGPLAGAILFGAPTAVVVVLSLGLGVPWSVSARGMLANALPDGQSLSPGALLDGGDRPLWVLSFTLACLALLCCGVLAAARSPLPAGAGHRPRPDPRRAAALAGRLGLVMAVTVAGVTALAGVSVDLGLTAFGMELVGTEVSLHGNVLAAFGAGLAAGGAAGFLGSVILDVLRVARGRSW